MDSSKEFYTLRRCLQLKKLLFCDPDFIPSKQILSDAFRYKDVQWLRPHEICKDSRFQEKSKSNLMTPQFVVEGFSRFDVQQGDLGDCWFLAALAALAENKTLLHKVVPVDNGFDVENYSGIFQFRFWKNGKWVTIIIDDRLPAVEGKLIYTKAPKSEFWPALLEKAYAKFYGSYNSIDGGFISEAMVDFTGGIIERYRFSNSSEAPPDLFNIIMRSHQRGSLIGTSMFENEKYSREKKMKGLIDGHAYSITSTKTVRINASKEVKIIRIKNPWTNHVEWNGPFSDKSEEWKLVPKKAKDAMKHDFKDDGEFFMPFNDFLSHFDNVEICHLFPENKDSRMKWNVSTFDGKWVPGVKPPQIIIRLSDPDKNDAEDLCDLYVSLMQKNRRKSQSVNFLPLQFSVYKLNNVDVDEIFLSDHFLSCKQLVGEHKRESIREIGKRFKLPPGLYCIILPQMNHSSGEFMVRCFTETLGNDENIIVKVNEIGNVQQAEHSTRCETMIEIPENDNVDFRTAREQDGTERSTYCCTFLQLAWKVIYVIALFIFILCIIVLGLCGLAIFNQN